MSLIHQALKKLEGESVHGASRREYSFSLKGARASRLALALPAALGLAAALYMLSPGSDASRIGGQTEPAKAQAQAPAPAAEPTADGLNRQGMEEYALGRYKEAAAAFRRASSLDAQSAHIDSNLGLSLHRLGDRAGAETAFKKALGLRQEGYPEAMNNYAALLFEAGDLKKAGGLLDEALKAAPGYADAHFNMAALLEKKGEMAAAIEHYERFLGGGADAEASAQVRKKIMVLRSALILKHARGS